MEEYYDSSLALWGLKCEEPATTEAKFLEVFDIKEDIAAVRFKNGNCGIVDCNGKLLMRLPKCNQVEFAENDFLKIVSEQNFMIDMRSKAVYSCMPKSKKFGEFELLYAGGFIYTRTQKIYEVREHTFMPCLAKNGLYMTLPCDNFPIIENEGLIYDVGRWIKDRFHAICLLTGDNKQTYWFYREMKDGSIIIMDDKIKFFHVIAKKTDTGKVIAKKRKIGSAKTSEEETVLNEVIFSLELRIDRKVKNKKKREKREEEKDRLLILNKLCDSLPFKVGGKWGLKHGKHIVVPPKYRSIKPPVGKYCAVEITPMNWGVIAVDGKMMVEPRYEEINISEDGMAELIIYKGKSIKLKLD